MRHRPKSYVVNALVCLHGVVGDRFVYEHSINIVVYEAYSDRDAFCLFYFSLVVSRLSVQSGRARLANKKWWRDVLKWFSRCYRDIDAVGIITKSLGQFRVAGKLNWLRCGSWQRSWDTNIRLVAVNSVTMTVVSRVPCLQTNFPTAFRPIQIIH